MLLCIHLKVQKRASHTDISILNAIANMDEAELKNETAHNDLFAELADSVTSSKDVGEYLVILLIERAVYNLAQNMMSYNLIHYEVRDISQRGEFTGILCC